MAAKEFAEYKYNAGVASGKTFKYVLIWLLAIGVFVLCIALVMPVLLALLIVPVVLGVFNARSASPNSILIGGRYLVVGNDVVYYNNIDKAHIDKKNRVFTIKTGLGKTVEIKAENFPTDARKPDKIANNKAGKFDKVAEKIALRMQDVKPVTAE